MTERFGAKIPHQAARVAVLYVISRAGIRPEARFFRKWALGNTSSTSAVVQPKEVLARINRHKRPVTTESSFIVKDGELVHGQFGFSIKDPIPVRLRAGVPAVPAKSFLVLGKEVAMPGKEMADKVDVVRLRDVHRGEKVKFVYDGFEFGSIGGLARNALHGLDVTLFLKRSKFSPTEV